MSSVKNIVQKWLGGEKERQKPMKNGCGKVLQSSLEMLKRENKGYLDSGGGDALVPGAILILINVSKSRGINSLSWVAQAPNQCKLLLGKINFKGFSHLQYLCVAND